MSTYRTRTHIGADGSIVLKQVPIPPGAEVSVTIEFLENRRNPRQPKYPYSGKIKYKNWDPFGPAAALEDWEALRDSA
jgi:hypothetical protein